jgi:DNA-binding transcriptional LysR family regulator
MQARAANIPWDDVRLFLSLCRSRTLGEAGKRLGVDASTLSRRLVNLERCMQATLFERSRDGIVATEAALQLQPVAEEMEHTMARFSGAVESFEREVGGLVRIACPGDAAEVLLAPLLPQLLSRYPKLRIELAAGESVVDLSRREADLALRTARPVAGELVVTRLLSVVWKVAASRQLAKGLHPLKAWNEVPWVGCSPRFADTTPGRWYREHVGKVDPVVRSDSLQVQLACVHAGIGVALVPERSLDALGLVPIKLSRALHARMGPWPTDDLLLVTHRSLRRVPRVRAVWDFLLEAVAERA